MTAHSRDTGMPSPGRRTAMTAPSHDTAMTAPDRRSEDTPLALAVDIGGTKIAVGLVAADGTLHERRRTVTPAGPSILPAVFELARPLVGRAMACGIGTAGTVGPLGRIASATDLLTGWAGTDVKGAAESALGLPTAVLNDCHAAGAAEARVGAARDARTALVVAIGTGIGGAVCVEGRVLTGASGTAGAIGHLPAPTDAGVRCSCGALDHIEAHASGPAIERAYLHTTGRALTLTEIGRLASQATASIAATSHETAARVIAEAAVLMGRVLAGAANLIDPGAIVIAGGVSMLGPALLRPMEAAFRAETLPGPSAVPLLPARLGADAGLVGAGLEALSHLENGSSCAVS
ncbi:glucokinase [Nonomuraea solani]|uniref:Glucokinase n=1 Tax=Nonomuraea solani TaxID=1144553 RepID=A0A1H6EIL0_9ACTN|nr:ROK family protein [Nonomuraea solani]SEG96584.1 glucokinase [Nonomuraea solani]